LKRVLAVLGAAALILGLAPGGSRDADAQSIGDRLARARSQRQRAALTVQMLTDDLAALRIQRVSLERSLRDASRQLLQAYARELAASTRLTLAEETLDHRAREAYQLGGASTLAYLLAADEPSELVDAQEFATSAMVADAQAVESVEAAKAALSEHRALVEARERELTRKQQELVLLLDEISARLQEAKAAAREAGLLVHELEEQLAAIEAAKTAAAGGAGIDLDPANGVDQSALLALLGPTGGRTCDIPSGLRDTGQGIAGDASWYGWDFAGNPTASGAIYDPRLFTVANRELPLGTFLRIRYQDRCAIVLVNDRGPYGDYDRILDLSLGVAQYLGTEHIGVAYVQADILVPR